VLITTRPCALHETEIDYDQQRIHRAANPLPVMVQQDPPTQPTHIPDSHDERHLAATVAALRISFAFLILPQISVGDRLRKIRLPFLKKWRVSRWILNPFHRGNESEDDIEDEGEAASRARGDESDDHSDLDGLSSCVR
jgi:hypothetical protein